MEDEKHKVKDQILYLLKTQGAQTATALAAQLQVSPMAIRQHLQQLKARQQVFYLEERRPLGRPVKLWQLTGQAAAYFPDRHADLTVELLRSITAVYGLEGVKRIIAERQQHQIETYRARLAAQPQPPDQPADLESSSVNNWQHQVQAIAHWRTQEGYMAEVVELEGTLLLIENHCPICTAARTCQQLCSAEIETFRAVFGATVSVERVEHILQGDRRCAYQIRKLVSESLG